MIYILHDKVFEDGTLCIGGIQTYLYNLSLSLSSEHDVVICQLGSEFDAFQVNGLKVISVPTDKVSKIPAFQKLNIQKEDVVVWGTDSHVIKGNYKSISIQHGIGFDYTNTNSKLKLKVMKSCLGHLFKLGQRLKSLKLTATSDHVVCVDYNYLNWYRTYTRNNISKKITVIPNFTTLPDREPIVFKDKEIIEIVYARRFIEKRGVYIFCEAIKNILDRHSNIRVTFAGDGPLKPYIESSFKGESRVCITSYQAYESLEFHKKFDIAVVPTIAGEGTSLSLLEAMASGCAVIASNVGGMTNIILNRFNGFLIDPRASEIEKSLDRLISNDALRVEMSKNAYKSTSSSFSFDIWKEQWLELITRIKYEK
ncbi:Alpha-D-kanosaminyltransferase [Pseudoalteromonas sp. P1-30]|jgi:glycosyltransferase involved in cell wall biosynthesis|uniref:glycosyltransferase family 4 protein n=1 Tax=Pseudoalteromonas sp. P1-30 TaxID=1723760 RepID=UPI0006D5E15A|nr:glycosyltransferase family 4 protein [Pseudoalteromonas sp. P1-30]KPV91526.1 Alpha-D-kanosaminyltransferase [Pseudoalteromonas sp. P1-30]